jgi:Restriction endonuclease PvuII
MATYELFKLLQQAQKIALEKHGVPNILQPGVMKELMMAEILGHDLIPKKDSADAKDKEGNTYEYLASIRRINVTTNRGCSFQLDRVTPSNLNRVTRNKAFYFGIFKNHLEVEEIWKVEVSVVLAEVKRQIENCKNDMAHVNFLLKWLEANGKRVFAS